MWTKAVLPIMRAQKEDHILNISSVAGLVAGMGSGVNCSTKFAVEGFSESLAQDVEKFGIKVTIIEPGPFRTDFAGASIQIPALAEYQTTQESDFRERLKKIHGNQQGDPKKATKIKIQITEKKHPPLRLLLGNNALERTCKKLDEQLAEIKRYEALSRSADYDTA